MPRPSFFPTRRDIPPAGVAPARGEPRPVRPPRGDRARHLERRKFDEVAARLGRSPGAVRMPWLRAIENLQQVWEAPSGSSAASCCPRNRAGQLSAGSLPILAAWWLDLLLAGLGQAKDVDRAVSISRG